MKNEVKKKMMIERRKLSHQSHDDRVFGSKSQEVFSQTASSCSEFSFRDRIVAHVELTSADMNRVAWFQRGRWFRSLRRDAFFRRCIYNGDRKIFVGA